ncbi:glycosyltransferase [Roseomonas gilardii]|uniref:Glycosyltransferase n=1 Tax=Roseomonas gilardii TaxID=257708 RepID=A0ABU3MH55_9PROT|nr:glycosyltransferase [Roseomonas gilardii]MDT8331970.1 glycosyltransferase [Roseomonas gilardii]
MRLLIDMQGAQGTSRLRGIGRYSRDLALSLAREARGHEVHLLLNGTLGDGGDALREAFGDLLPDSAFHRWWGPEGAPDVTEPRPARRAAGEILRAEAIAALAPDLLLATSLFEGSSDDVIARWPPDRARPATAAICYDLIPLIQRQDYLDGPWAGAQRLKDWYFRCLHEMAEADLLLAISEASRQDAMEQLALPGDQVVNIRAGYSPVFGPQRMDAAERQALLGRYGLRDGFVLFVGGGDPRKNEAGLLRAQALLPPALRARHQLVIVGATDPGEFVLARKAAGLGAEEAALIRFVPEADLPALYAACSLSVLPSFYEGFGLPVLEAMACGAPAIGSRAGSLPEVIGLEEALFDPHDPADIARVMSRALAEPGFRARLLAHAPAQAARFGWADTAARSWSALEALLESPRLRDRPAHLVPGRRLPRLALVSPLPPQPTGIADYTRELAPALARHYDVTLVCESGHTEDERLRGAFPVLDAATFRSLGERFDRVLYQLGNSDLHDFQYRGLLAEQPGVATLHDSFLSGHALWQAYRNGDRERFVAALHASHGWPAVATWLREGEIAATRAWPCSLPVLRDTIGVIQHSRHAVEWTQRHYDAATAGEPAIIPHLRRIPPKGDRAAARRRLGLAPDLPVIASFGILAASKLPDRLVAACHGLRGEGQRPLLALVGEAVEQLDLPRESATLRLTGRVSPQAYADWMAAADIAVQLRDHSRGETSGALIDCLAAGLPVVVNRHGTMSQVPDDCLRTIPERFEDGDLRAVLQELLQDPASGRQIGARARKWVRETLSPERIGLAYREAIEAFHARPGAFLRLGDPFRGALLPPGSAGDWAAVARASTANFPPRRPPFLFLDVTEGWSDMAELERLLLAHPPTLRVEPVRFEVPVEDGDASRAARPLPPAPPGTYRTAPEAAFELLGQRFAHLRPGVLPPAPGDLLLRPSADPLPMDRQSALRALERRGCILAARDAAGTAVPAAGAILPVWFQALLPS